MSLSIREADVSFADLICADPQWLDAEFDALISASFSEPPAPPRPAPPRIPPRPGFPRRPPSWRPPSGPAAVIASPTEPGHGRQRSPPARLPAGRQARDPEQGRRSHDSKPATGPAGRRTGQVTSK
jgi:hypothetical protein